MRDPCIFPRPAFGPWATWVAKNTGGRHSLSRSWAGSMPIDETWADFEGRAQLHHADLMAAAQRVADDPAAVERMLSDFSYQHAMEAYQMGEDLQCEVFTRIALLNNPHTILQYQDPKKWVLKAMVH